MTAINGASAVKILIVDDEIIIVADLEHRVRSMGYTVCGVAASGRQALEAAFRARPDLVLMDVVLQGEMDGIETAQVIRDTLGIPSVFITAYAGDDRLERAKLAYPFGYILKPFQDRDLRVTIEMALYVARNEAERRLAEAELEQTKNELEERVRQRTRELEILNSHLMAEIEDRKRIEADLITQQERLNRLASELVLTEERERRQLAVILHDQIGQSLAFCKMQIKAMIKKSEWSEPAGQMQQVCDTIDLMIRTSRSLTLELSPPILYELGLKAAVEWVAERMESDFGIPIEVKGAGSLPPLADDLKILLFRAIKELLVNAVKHALPSRIRVSLSADQERIQVKVRDDGVGFPQAEPTTARQTSGGYGLFNIRERLASLGGWMMVESESGLGTEITLIIPLNHTAKRL